MKDKDDIQETKKGIVKTAREVREKKLQGGCGQQCWNLQRSAKKRREKCSWRLANRSPHLTKKNPEAGLCWLEV